MVSKGIEGDVTTRTTEGHHQLCICGKAGKVEFELETELVVGVSGEKVEGLSVGEAAKAMLLGTIKYKFQRL